MINNYNVAAYIRLSKEDTLKDENSNSESVDNQKSIIIRYINEKKYNLFKIYIDDGFSGTNFERPQFKKMIEDIKHGFINMVIVKDLSRFGRDYVLTGYYLDIFFPQNNIRFVSILDNIDSLSNDICYDFIPFKSVINDMYSKDNSKKIKAALRIKQLNGKWVGGCPPFGYMQDKYDKNHLTINEKEANIVKKIFSLFLNGNSINMIATYLHDSNIPTPNVMRNVKRNYKYCKYGYWSSSTIKSILTNQLYTGDMIQNRRSRVNYKIKKIRNNSPDEWIIVTNMHKSIISKADFFLVQNRFKNSLNVKSIKKYDYLLCGLLSCYDCHKKMVIQKNKDYMYCVCNTYKKYSKLHTCKSHCINYYLLEEKVINSIKDKLSLCNIDMVSKIVKNKIKQKDNIERINKIKDILRKLYVDKLENNIDEKTYLDLSRKYECELNNCSKNNYINFNEYIFNLINDVNKSLIFRLINKILIHEDKTIDIYFNFKPILPL